MMPISIRYFMGETYAELTLTNLFRGRSLRIQALVDTGATWMVVTPQVAEALGYDLEELVVSNVTVADGRRIPVPQIGALEIAFHPGRDAEPDRRCPLGAVVLGDQCLMGQIPLEALDLIIDPLQQRVVGRHEGGPVYRA